MLFILSIAFANETLDYAEQVLARMEADEEMLARAMEEARDAEDGVAVRCLGRTGGEVEATRRRTEQALERLEAAVDDASDYAISVEYNEVLRQDSLHQQAFYQAGQCWPMSPGGGGGGGIDVYFPGSLHLDLGAMVQSDPLLDGSQERGLAAYAAPELSLSLAPGWFQLSAVGSGEARRYVDPKTAELSRWADLDAGLDLQILPYRRVSLFARDRLEREARDVRVLTPELGPVPHTDFESHFGLVFGDYRQLELGAVHRWDAAQLPTPRSVQGWGPAVELRLPVRGSNLVVSGELERFRWKGEDIAAPEGWRWEAMAGLQGGYSWTYDARYGFTELRYGEDLERGFLHDTTLSYAVGSHAMSARLHRELEDHWIGTVRDATLGTLSYQGWLTHRVPMSFQAEAGLERWAVVPEAVVLYGGELEAGFVLNDHVQLRAAGFWQHRDGLYALPVAEDRGLSLALRLN